MSKAISLQSARRSQAPARVAVRQGTIVDELRAQIVRGQFEPGHRLPSRIEIERQFGASTMTVQRALETLKNDGFIVASRGDGTYVSEHPPHLSRYGIVFPAAPDRKGWNRFWTALSQEATALQSASTLELALYHGVDEHHDGEDYGRLVADVCAHRLAGLIFAAPNFLYRDTPLLDEPDIPRVEFAAKSESDLPAVAINNWSLIERALDFFAAQKRRRVAFIMASGAPEPQERLMGAAQARGLQSHARFCHSVHRAWPATARGIAQLMFHDSQTQRPDALLIGDDNLVEQTTRGIADVGRQDEISIVAHCNFPHLPDAATPVTWLGFDARQILALCLQSLDAQRNHQPTPQFTPVTAQFADELAARAHDNRAICKSGST